jgi:hypothetical protein
MNGHGKSEVANPGKHVHYILALAKTAHSYALHKVSRREHHQTRIQIEDHFIFFMYGLGLVAGDGSTYRLAKGAKDAIIG